MEATALPDSLMQSVLIQPLIQPFFVQDDPGESVPEGYTILNFAEAEMMWVAVASAELYASHLHSAPEDNHASTSSVRFLRAGRPS